MLASMDMNLMTPVAVVVVPAATYFLLLGLLNSQSTPQLLSGRKDFVLLTAAFSPFVCVPVLNYFGAGAWALLAVLACLFGATLLLAPRRGRSWVVYNIVMPDALRAIERSLRELDEPFDRRGRRLVLRNRDITLRLSSMPLLRNVTISVEGVDVSGFGEEFGSRLSGQLAGIRSAVTPMAVTCLLLAAAMLIAPLGLFADQVPQMVRILTDLVK